MGGHCVVSYIEDGKIPKRLENVCQPLYFHPALEVFSIPVSCPKEVAEQIRMAFSHYFYAMKASANAIRTALELLMDAQKVKKTKMEKSGKRKPQTLHARIEDFGKLSPDLNPYLVAIKMYR